MKSRVIELQEKANQLLELAQAMDKKCLLIEDFIEMYTTYDYKPLKDKALNRLDTCQRGSRRLWNAYLQVLTQIKLEL